MRNRQKDEMVRDILTSANGGSTISQIMFRAYASHSQAKTYLTMLVEKGYIEYDPIERKYRTSPQGLEYLAAVHNLSEILSIETRRCTKESAENPFLL
jgi:predicted transcriptional regulator